MKYVSVGMTQTGFSTIELLCAFAIGMLFLTGATLLAFGGQTNITDLSLGNVGMYSAITQIKNAVASTTQDWYATPTLKPIPLYTQTNTITYLSPCMKQIESDTTWFSEHTRSQKALFSTYVAGTKQSEALGNVCDPFPPSSWDTPTVFGSTTISSSTSIAVASLGGNRYAFVTANPPTAQGADFVVFDVHDAQHPINIGTPVQTLKGITAVALTRSYAYVLQNENGGQLQVIDIQDPEAPVVVSSASRTLPYIMSTCSPSTPCLSGRSITYYQGRIYIGTSYIAFGPATHNHELHVYCVDDPTVPLCTPKTPVWLGSYNVNHNVNDIVVRTQVVGGIQKTLAYIANSATSPTEAELRIFDVTNPGAITLVGSLNPSGINYGQSLYVLGSTVYVGRDRATASNKDFHIVDVSNPQLPIERSSKRLGLAVGTKVSSIIVQGHIAYVATTDNTKPLFIFDLEDPTNPHAVSGCSATSLGMIQDIFYHQNMLFTVTRAPDTLQILYDNSTMCP